MKQVNIFLILILLITILTGAFGATLDTFTFDVASSKDLSTVNATIKYLDGADFNALCLSLSDGNDTTSCMEMDEPGSPFEFDMNHNIVNGLSSNVGDVEHTIFAVILLDDGNFSNTESATIIIDNSAPVLSASYPIEDGAYNASIDDFNFSFTDASPLNTASAVFKVNGGTITITDENISEITDGNRFTFSPGTLVGGDNNVTYDINDILGNKLTGTINFVYDNTAPNPQSATNSYTSTWTNKDKPTFTVSATDTGGSGLDKVAFSCKSDGTYHLINYATSITTFDITVDTYDCNTSDGTKTIYVKFIDKAGNWSSPITTTVKYDNTAPNAPTGLSASVGDGEVSLSWTAPAADALSGNAGYRVYVDGVQNKTVTSGTSTTVTGLTNDRTYKFRVTTYDNAGNESGFSNEVSKAPEGEEHSVGVTVKKGSTIVEYARSGDTLTITGTYNENVTSGRLRYRYYQTSTGSGGTTQTLEGPVSGVKTIEETIVLDTGYEKICFWADGTDFLSNEKCIIIDNVSPTIVWVGTIEKLSDNATIRVTANDNRLIDRIVFTLGTTEFSSTKKDTNAYETTIDTKSFANGTNTLKAKAIDKAGNIKEISLSVEIENLSTPSDLANAAITSAESLKAIVDDLMKYFAEQGIIFPEELKTEKEAADLLLEEAKSLKEFDANTAKVRADEAKAKYQSINGTAKFEEVPNQIIIYDIPAELNAIFSGIGLNDEQRAQAIGILSNSSVERKLIIVKVGEGENAEYQAKIEITFINNSETTELKIVEVIPKELLESASKIFSDYNFVILQDDPIIEFNISVAIGASKTITYSIGNVTQEEAEAMINDNIIAKFSAPPAILSSETDTSNLKQDNGLITIIVYALVAIVLLVIIVAGVVVFMKDDGSLGSNGSFLDKISEKISSIGKQEKKGNKWAYKEK